MDTTPENINTRLHSKSVPEDLSANNILNMAAKTGEQNAESNYSVPKKFSDNSKIDKSRTPKYQNKLDDVELEVKCGVCLASCVECSDSDTDVSSASPAKFEKSEIKSNKSVISNVNTVNSDFNSYLSGDNNETSENSAVSSTTKSLQCNTLEFMKPVSPSCKLQVVRLVEEKPLLNFEIESKKFQGLWDTGSMVCLGSQDWLGEHFPNHELYPVSGFAKRSDPITLCAANGSELVLQGVVILKVSSPFHNVIVDAPFLVSVNDLENPIIGFNLISYLIENSSSQSLSTRAFMKAIPMPKVNAKALVSVIQNDISETAEIGKAYLNETIVIPSNCFTFVK